MILKGPRRCKLARSFACKPSIRIRITDGADAPDTVDSVRKSASKVTTTVPVERCHEKLRATRGVVLSLAFVDPEHGMMTWLGVGNVHGVLMRSDARKGNVQESLLLRDGVVGSQLPALQATVLLIVRGGTLFFATDGVRSDFSMTLSARENPQGRQTEFSSSIAAEMTMRSS